jgi:hypothetical protein
MRIWRVLSSDSEPLACYLVFLLGMARSGVTCSGGEVASLSSSEAGTVAFGVGLELVSKLLERRRPAEQFPPPPAPPAAVAQRPLAWMLL